MKDLLSTVIVGVVFANVLCFVFWMGCRRLMEYRYRENEMPSSTYAYLLIPLAIVLANAYLMP